MYRPDWLPNLLNQLRSGVATDRPVVVKASPMGPLDTSKTIVALANGDAGGVVLYGVHPVPGFESSRWAPDRRFNQVVTDAINRIGGGSPAVAIYKTDNLAAIVVDSCTASGHVCFDTALGRDHGLYLLRDGRVAPGRSVPAPSRHFGPKEQLLAGQSGEHGM